MKTSDNLPIGTLILVLKRGDEILDSLSSYINDNCLNSAWITGIGALSEARLALYDLETKEYHHKDLAGPLELINLNGNVGKYKNEIALHLHVTLSDKNMKAFGGHLLMAKVAATCEIKISPLATPILRKHDSEIGLNLIDG